MTILLQHVNVKFFVDGELNVDQERFINIFHTWIREGSLPGLLIDVADYRHVPGGPGVMLIGHEGDYNMDHTDNRWGLRYSRKKELDGTNHERFRLSLGLAASACRMLEVLFADDGSLKFSRREFELVVNDRALAPNTPETLEAITPELESFLEETLGHDDFHLTPPTDPRRLFGVTVVANKPFDLAALAAPVQA